MFRISAAREPVAEMSPDLRILRRADGREASRAYVLVAPSVVCANAVSREIAEHVVDAVAVAHQHGCAQIGDDAVGTTRALESLASHPNAWTTLIVSLGCETLQGRALLERLRSRGVLCDLVGIQDEGGSDAAVAAGIQACQSLVPPLTQTRHEATAPIAVGVSFSGGNEDVASEYADALRRAGIQAAAPQDVSRSPVLATVEMATEASALAIVHVGERSGSGPVLTPLISVASDQDAFRGAEDEFDVVEPNGEELVETVVRVLNGEPTVSERRGDAFFAIRRSLLTL